MLDAKIRMAKKRLLSSEGSHAVSASGRLLGIILDSEEEALKMPFLELQKKLGIAEENIYFLLCGKKRPENAIFGTAYFAAEDLSWNGRIKNGETEVFFDRSYDLLISFAASENKLAAFAVSVARAGLKVGRQSSQKCDFDLLISTDDPELFTAELEKYLKILKTAV